MFCPWIPAGAAWPGARSSWPILGAVPCGCASAPPTKVAAPRTAAATTSRKLRIVVLPLDGPDLQGLLPVVVVAGLPARRHVLAVGALVGRGVALDAAGRLVP